VIICVFVASVVADECDDIVITYRDFRDEIGATALQG